MNNETKETKQDLFIHHLKEALLNVSTACKDAEIGRTSYYNWMKQKGFKKKVHEANEYVKDMMESALKVEGIKGNVQALRLWLETNAKDRGYGVSPDTQVNIQNIQLKHPEVLEKYFKKKMENDK